MMLQKDAIGLFLTICIVSVQMERLTVTLESLCICNLTSALLAQEDIIPKEGNEHTVVRV